jgi:tRNA threonylcarbamoyladenosine biosynthesis protein TsaE
MTTTTHSGEETKAVAAALAKQLRGGECISLIGDLGAGKTTFTQGLVAALGSAARVKSPTFTVMNEYPVVGHPSIRRVVHCDVYRFATAREIGALELDEYRRPDTVIVAEWPNILAEMDWRPDIVVTIHHPTPDTRNPAPNSESSRTIEIQEIS